MTGETPKSSGKYLPPSIIAIAAIVITDILMSALFLYGTRTDKDPLFQIMARQQFVDLQLNPNPLHRIRQIS